MLDQLLEKMQKEGKSGEAGGVLLLFLTKHMHVYTWARWKDESCYPYGSRRSSWFLRLVGAEGYLLIRSTNNALVIKD